VLDGANSEVPAHTFTDSAEITADKLHVVRGKGSERARYASGF
jgi:hypothetical protein